jgi:hypothetical protein
VAPHTLQERLQHIAEFRSITGSEIPWICDSMDNMFANAFGGAPNGEFVIDPEGLVLRQRFWSNPVTLRRDLSEFVGAVVSPTAPGDALPAFELPRREIASGVVPRIELPGNLQPLITIPGEDEFPAYAKLRVEAGPELLGEDRKGQMYLGVYLDPVYRVHWNNRAGNVVVQLHLPEGMQASQTRLQGPDVSEDADIDPRMFLIELDRAQANEPLRITLGYTVCDDAETFCHSIAQEYTVEFRTDRELGSRPGVFMPGMFARVSDLDRDGNGRIEGVEFPEGRATLYLSHMDLNLDGAIDTEEIRKFMALFNDGRGFQTPWNDGRQPLPDRD